MCESKLNILMKDKDTHMLDSRALSICEEFCRYVIVDQGNESILTNTKIEYYDELVARLKGLGYVQLFVAAVHPKETVTSTFLRTHVE